MVHIFKHGREKKGKRLHSMRGLAMNVYIWYDTYIALFCFEAKIDTLFLEDSIKLCTTLFWSIQRLLLNLYEVFLFSLQGTHSLYNLYAEKEKEKNPKKIRVQKRRKQKLK